MTVGFVHLRVHSEYSLVDGLLRIPELVSAVAERNMGAVALTDQSNLFGMVKFYRAAVSRGIKPIIGCDAWLAPSADDSAPTRLGLLCMDETGYRNLARLVTRSYTEGQQQGRALLREEWLTEEACVGLIALSGAREGDVGRALLAGRPEEARAAVSRWRRLFPERYYLEIQRTGRNSEEAHVAAAVELAASEGLPLVATNDVRFLGPRTSRHMRQGSVSIRDTR